MKVKRISSQDFKPIEISIILETEDEAKKFYHLFNSYRLNKLIGFDGNGIREAIGDFYNGDFSANFWNEIKEMFKK